MPRFGKGSSRHLLLYDEVGTDSQDGRDLDCALLTEPAKKLDLIFKFFDTPLL